MSEIQETLVSFEVAKLAKKKGCNIQTSYNYHLRETNWYYKHTGELHHYSWFSSFDNMLFAPTQDLLQKWLREVHNIHIILEEGYNTHNEKIKFYPVLFPFKDKFKEVNGNSRLYFGDVWKDTYEEAREEALFKALNLLPDVNI